MQPTLRFIPLVNPIDHAQQRKSRGARAHSALGMNAVTSLPLPFLLRFVLHFLLHFPHQVFEEVYIIFFAGVDALAQSRRKRMIFVQHHRNFAVPRAEHGLDVQPDQRPQPLFRIGDPAHRSDHTILRDLHRMVHDLEQDFVFALKVVVESALTELERRRDVVHRRGVIAALLKQTRGRTQDFLPGLDHRLAGHRLTWYTVAGGNTNGSTAGCRNSLDCRP